MATYDWVNYFKDSAQYNNYLAGLVMRQGVAITNEEKTAIGTLIEEQINEMPIIIDYAIVDPAVAAESDDSTDESTGEPGATDGADTGVI